MTDDQEIKKTRISDPKVGLVKAQSYCAYQERCQQEVRDKLYSWGLWPEAVENIIVQLITDNFLNEERFAKSFAGGKFRIKKWGRVKIKMELKKRKISDYCIRSAMKEIDGDEYEKTLKKIIAEQEEKFRKKKMTGRFTPEIKKHRILQYCISRGFESDIVREFL